MFRKVERAVTRSARLVLDPREWFGSVFAAGPELEIPRSGGGTDLVRTVVRPDGPLTVTATPTRPPDPRWPFPGPVELVTRRTPSGLLAFFGRVRPPGGGPLRRLLLEGTACDLRVEGPGYRPAVLTDVRIPGRHEPPELPKVVMLFPGPDFPFPAGTTALLGGVFRPDATPEPGVRVTAPGVAGLEPAVTDADGLWTLVLDRPRAAGGVPPSPITLEFQTGGQTIPVPGVSFQPGRMNRFPQTLLRGRVETADRREVAGATVTVTTFPGEAKTRPDGAWVFYLGLDQPLAGERDVVIEVTPPGRPPTRVGARVTFGQANEIPVITA